MKFEKLRREVCEANVAIGRTGLAMFTWGNASGIDRDAAVVAIKPSGVDYSALRPADIVVLDLASGRRLSGELNPSSDTPTHLCLYRAFRSIGGVVHTHSIFATAWAQALREIPCFGTTHADVFYGPVPLTRKMKKAEVVKDYELNTGRVIVERFRRGKLDYSSLPGVLVAGHGPFTWGKNAGGAVENGRVLEKLAEMAFYTRVLKGGDAAIDGFLLDKHYLRKHGAGAYYGQGRG